MIKIRPATAIVTITSLIGVAGTVSAMYMGETIPKEAEVSAREIMVFTGLAVLGVGFGAYYVTKKYR